MGAPYAGRRFRFHVLLDKAAPCWPSGLSGLLSSALATNSRQGATAWRTDRMAKRGIIKERRQVYGDMANHKYRPELSARRPRSAGKAPPAIPGGWQAGFTLPPWHWLAAPYTFRPLVPVRAIAASAGEGSPRTGMTWPAVRRQAGGTRRASGGCRDQCRASGAACVSSVKERGKGKTQAKPGEPGALRVFR